MKFDSIKWMNNAHVNILCRYGVSWRRRRSWCLNAISKNMLNFDITTSPLWHEYRRGGKSISELIRVSSGNSFYVFALYFSFFRHFSRTCFSIASNLFCLSADESIANFCTSSYCGVWWISVFFSGFLFITGKNDLPAELLTFSIHFRTTLVTWILTPRP